MNSKHCKVILQRDEMGINGIVLCYCVRGGGTPGAVTKAWKVGSLELKKEGNGSPELKVGWFWAYFKLLGLLFSIFGLLFSIFGLLFSIFGLLLAFRDNIKNWGFGAADWPESDFQNWTTWVQGSPIKEERRSPTFNKSLWSDADSTLYKGHWRVCWRSKGSNNSSENSTHFNLVNASNIKTKSGTDIYSVNLSQSFSKYRYTAVKMI